MTFHQVISELEKIKNEKGIKYYQKTFGEKGNYLGLGLTPLKKIAKKIKTNPEVAADLSNSEYFEAKMLGFMVDDPNKYDLKTLDQFIKNLPSQYSESPLSYFTMVFSEFILAKSPDAEKFVKKYSKHKSSTNRFLAFSTLNNLGKSKKVDDNFFEPFLKLIEENIQKEANNVKDAMNNSMLSWGQRSKKLNSQILKSYKKIGEIIVDYGETSCKTPNVPAILSSERIQNKFS